MARPVMIPGRSPVNRFPYDTNGPQVALLRLPQFIIIEHLSQFGMANIYFWIGTKFESLHQNIHSKRIKFQIIDLHITNPNYSILL